MSKIICDVCGTRYPDTAEQCPICGHIREAAGKTAEDVLVMDEARPEPRKKVRGGRFSKSNVKKRTGGAAHYEAATARSKPAKKAEAAYCAPDEDIFTEDNQNKKANTILNVLLVIVIIALLAVTGYIFVQHVLPQLNKPEETLPPPVVTETNPVTEAPTESQEPTIPCEELVLEETEILLTEYEQKWLINVEVKPGDTTDKLTFTSADELIATVDSEGCITALAEGQTYITIACGDVQVQYDVVCLFPGVDIKPGEVPTDPPPTDPPVEMTITTNYVNVRAGAGTGYAKVAQLHKGDKVLVYEKTVVSGREWGRVDQGWICLEYAK